MQRNAKRWLFDAIVWSGGIALAAATFIADAGASERMLTTPMNAPWRAECGSCHVPYPPQLLPAQSWRAIMNGLDRHFGTDASVDAKTRDEIASFLDRNAGTNRHASAEPAPLRITQTRWFLHEHSEIPDRLRSGYKTLSDCAQCHRNAASGDFGERTLQLAR